MKSQARPGGDTVSQFVAREPTGNDLLIRHRFRTLSLQLSKRRFIGVVPWACSPNADRVPANDLSVRDGGAALRTDRIFPPAQCVCLVPTPAVVIYYPAAGVFATTLKNLPVR